MKCTVRLLLAMVCMTITLASVDVNAGMRTKGPPDHFSTAEKQQYWLGAIGRIAVRYCGYQAEGMKLTALAKKYEAGRYALARWGAGGYAGSCAQVKNEFIPWIQEIFKHELNPQEYESSSLEVDFSSWSNKQICNSAINKHSEIPMWSAHSNHAAGVKEAKNRGMTPGTCMVLHSLKTEQANAIPSASVRKLANIADLLREDLITKQEAEEKRREILGDL